ncbi:hypothetical protein CEE36_01590 [candidate division TA06 bacterium B3_TA06]|uniref:FlgD Ig-like domain-containing protein n=1 Tax=candidate division TA06 bacterium B3_TA06 TaxID=2012487 RepID=A0A532VA28_UNCT6|nr:MAG: hypothetical protein CEE36_01590 [candidate division TA06 bacterium B3_TA06]
MLQINLWARRTLAATVSLFVILAGWLPAATVTPQEATKAAMTHIQSMTNVWSQLPYLENQTITVDKLKELCETESNQLLGYVAELTPRGFVVLSGNTQLAPIIAYSYRCNFPWEGNADNILRCMLKTDLALREKAVSITDANILSANNSSWENYLAGEVLLELTGQWPSPGSTHTGGWVETTWRQTYPYNAYCPKDPGTGKRCVVGCVATAMSQIVDYHSDRRNYMSDIQLYRYDRYVSMMTSPYIRIDQDSSTYDFPSFNALNGYLEDLRNIYLADSTPGYYDVAALAFTCGIFVKMHYSSSGSGTNVDRVSFALMFKFGYPSAMNVDKNTAWFYDTLSQNMKDALPAELGIHYPDGSYGHAIVCDGLREIEGEDDQYHLNFGWGPDSPGPITTAWYVLPQGMPLGYRVISGGVLSIRPPEGSYVAERAEPHPCRFFIEQLSPTLQIAPAALTLSYGLPCPARVRLKIYDINGRMIKTLLDEDMPAGYHQTEWDTRDREGREVASGIYFCVLETKEGIYKTKAVVIR